MHFLEELGNQSNEDIAFLKNCIYYSNESILKMVFSEPTYDFAVKVKQPVKPAQARPAIGQNRNTPKQPAVVQPTSDNKRKPIPKPMGPSWTEKGHDDDTASLTSEVDPTKHFGHSNHHVHPPGSNTVSMAKRTVPAHAKPGPPPPNTGAKPQIPPPSRPAPPQSKTAFSNK